MALFGGLGAVARFVVDGELGRRLPARLAVATLVINVTGSFGLGLLTTPALAGGPVQLVLGTGFLGGFTTFSTASVELVRLAAAGRRGAALVLAVTMLAASALAATCGLMLVG